MGYVFISLKMKDSSGTNVFEMGTEESVQRVFDVLRDRE